MEINEEKSKEKTRSKSYGKKTIPKSLKINVWDFYVGKEKGSVLCLCCNNEEIRQEHYEARHIL